MIIDAELEEKYKRMSDTELKNNISFFKKLIVGKLEMINVEELKNILIKRAIDKIETIN